MTDSFEQDVFKQAQLCTLKVHIYIEGMLSANWLCQQTLGHGGLYAVRSPKVNKATKSDAEEWLQAAEALQQQTLAGGYEDLANQVAF